MNYKILTSVLIVFFVLGAAAQGGEVAYILKIKTHSFLPSTIYSGNTVGVSTNIENISNGIDAKNVKKIDKPWTMEDLVSKMVDCCRE